MKTVFFFDYFDNNSAEYLIKNLASAAKEDKNVRLIINSPGGVVTNLLAIVDSINLIDMNLETVCMGQAASCGAFLFSMGKKRYITKNARVLLHQVSGGAYGDIQDMQISIEEAKRLNEVVLDLLSKNTGKDKETLKKDLSRDFILTANEAVNYGIADSVISESLFTQEIQLFKKSQFEETVKSTITEMASNKEIKLCEIKNKELFKAGTYKGQTYTEKDIESLVSNTNYLIENHGFKIPIKLGHDNNSELSELFKDMLESDSMPAFGHVENIRVEGSSAVGDLVNIPEPLFNLIDKNFFCKKSPEIWKTYKIKDKTLGFVLDSIALLGAAQPEIPDLFTKECEDIQKGENIMPGTQLTEDQIKAQFLKEQEEAAKKQEEFAKKEQAIKDADEKAKLAEEARKKAEEELANFKANAKKKEFEAKAEELAKNGTILPYQKKALVAVLEKIGDSQDVIKFSKDEKEEELALSKAFEDLLSNRPKIDLKGNYSLDSKEEKGLSDADKESRQILEAQGYSKEEIKEMEEATNKAKTSRYSS